MTLNNCFIIPPNRKMYERTTYKTKSKEVLLIFDLQSVISDAKDEMFSVQESVVAGSKLNHI